MESFATLGKHDKVRDFVTANKLSGYPYFIYSSLRLDNIVGYILLWILFIVDFVFVRKTDLTTISYFVLFGLQIYLCDVCFKKLQLVQPNEGGDNEAIDYFMKPFDACENSCKKVTEKESVKKILSSPTNAPLLVTIGLIFGVIFAQIFKGAFLSFTACVAILIVPAIIKYNIHTKTAQIFMEKVWPKVEPLYQQYIEPQVSKVLNKVKHSDSSSSTTQQPESSPSSEVAQSAEASPSSDIAANQQESTEEANKDKTE
ncbi:uncharacterized protein MONOS_15322 [Monocercomonoides exilis]|uniref:uncharacterized protein n=1 Tax=Monocercomonoides exilis TaxID=2049356 RepID=UPI00355A2C52|nr:hypothetical protein MONOS_15322 [Monocercomonoides exilis]|eukprot:MONOS_15322.1-p1 / transcript=MONOS_15322.1 / gene=MONOS_15322 / organism=Monocercomonoides_exilis_PA203 / gene_product=unspecified product / transcript_product=unspecified product / location=Mono_scaffold01198:3718-4660(-) / protein_length=258 / sequence_SO=supercontig / SO=protein_coding / is_pseudo=false